jgi:thiol-disulfide isomerase/thioredoxin
MPPQIIASQDTFEVLQSGYAPVHPGDVLHALNLATFKAMMATVTNPLTSVVNIDARPGRVLHLARNGHETEVAIDRAASIRLVQFNLDPAQETPPSTHLRGLDTKDLTLASQRGRWTLLHFWATWCAPCIRHMPDIRELAQRKDLSIAAIGFADAEERLRAAAAKEKDVKIFAPDTPLQRELAITGIPFDALVDPDGKAVLVVAGDMSGEQFKKIVTEYVQR